MAGALGSRRAAQASAGRAGPAGLRERHRCRPGVPEKSFLETRLKSKTPFIDK
jgi:hypothetical protein